MQLSKLQRRSLEIHFRFRDERPTISALVRLSLWRILLIPAYCLAAVALFIYMRSEFGVGLMLGVIVGFLSSVIAQLRLFIKLWPAFREVIDWTKLGALLGR
jgi:preprotein translocase subunit SecF